MCRVNIYALPLSTVFNSKHELVEKCAICMFKLSVIVNINTVITEGLIANLVG